jgi:hypothetical protein
LVSICAAAGAAAPSWTGEVEVGASEDILRICAGSGQHGREKFCGTVQG